MKNDDKVLVMVKVMGSRRGRMNLREKMMNPIGGLSDPVPCDQCHLCALKESKCEELVGVIDGKTCLIPAGTIFIWDETG